MNIEDFNEFKSNLIKYQKVKKRAILYPNRLSKYSFFIPSYNEFKTNDLKAIQTKHIIQHNTQRPWKKILKNVQYR